MTYKMKLTPREPAPQEKMECVSLMKLAGDACEHMRSAATGQVLEKELESKDRGGEYMCLNQIAPLKIVFKTSKQSFGY
jgi:hypothetical protein